MLPSEYTFLLWRILIYSVLVIIYSIHFQTLTLLWLWKFSRGKAVVATTQNTVSAGLPALLSPRNWTNCECQFKSSLHNKNHSSLVLSLVMRMALSWRWSQQLIVATTMHSHPASRLHSYLTMQQSVEGDQNTPQIVLTIATTSAFISVLVRVR